MLRYKDSDIQAPRGFSLIEIMICLAILSAIVIANSLLTVRQSNPEPAPSERPILALARKIFVKECDLNHGGAQYLKCSSAQISRCQTIITRATRICMGWLDPFEFVNSVQTQDLKSFAQTTKTFQQCVRYIFAANLPTPGAHDAECANYQSDFEREHFSAKMVPRD